jgi:hypothetical protein
MKDYFFILKDLSRIELSSLLDYIRTNGLEFSAQPVLPQTDVMRWVDIEIQKPEYMQCCLITNQLGSVTEAQYTGESNIFSIGEDEYRATAWMELPPPFA